MIESIENNLKALKIETSAIRSILDDKQLENYQYFKLVHELCTKISKFRQSKTEIVEPVANPNNKQIEMFYLQLGSFLKDELGCPYESLQFATGVKFEISDNVQKTLLLDFLVTELMTIEMSRQENDNENKTKALENLREIANVLECRTKSKISNGSEIFDDILNSTNVVNEIGEKSIFNEIKTNPKMNETDWLTLERFRLNLHKDFRNRRKMLIKRMESTIQSFLWSSRLKATETEINEILSAEKARMSDDPQVSMADLLIARKSLLRIEKTSCRRQSNQSKPVSFSYKHIIGSVPDRGGRPSEQPIPEREKPSWQTQRNHSNHQGQQSMRHNRPQQQPRQQQQQQQQQLPFFHSQPPQRIDYAQQAANDYVANQQQSHGWRDGGGGNSGRGGGVGGGRGFARARGNYGQSHSSNNDYDSSEFRSVSHPKRGRGNGGGSGFGGGGGSGRGGYYNRRNNF